MARDRRTHYDVLRVDRRASSADVRAAYLRQARRHHPDTAGTDLSAISEAELEMRAINAAWEVLGDDEGRRRYDRTLPPLHANFDAGFQPASETHDAPPMPPEDEGGEPIRGVAKLMVRLAPLSFVTGFVVSTLGAVLQVGALWRVGLVVVILSLVLFLLAPFFVMGAAARHQ